MTSTTFLSQHVNPHNHEKSVFIMDARSKVMSVWVSEPEGGVIQDCILDDAVPRSSPWSRYLLTPWNRVLLEKLTGFQVVKKFPAFYGT